MHLSDYLYRNAKRLPNKPALVTDERSLSWQELAREVNSAAAALEPYLASGDSQQIIATLIPNSWQYVVVYLAIVHLGHIALPVDITFKKLEVDFVLEATRPSLIIAAPGSQKLVSGSVISTNEILGAGLSLPKKLLRLKPDQQIATLFLSSGTTGRPKPIPNTHANQLWDVAAVSAPYGWTEQDSLLINLHLTHRHGLVICLVGAIFHANTVYLTERFSVKRTIGLLESGKVTLYSALPSIYEQLVKFNPKRQIDFSQVRLFASSSSPMPPHLAQSFKARYGSDIIDRYGTSETGSIAVSFSSSQQSPGKLIKGVKLRIEPNGEVAIKSPGLFPGYYKNPSATRKNLTADGWWLTGDIGELKKDGLVLRGRTKERIIRSGYTIYSRDIEWALKKNPRVAEVKVISNAGPKELDDKIFAFFTGALTVAETSDYSRLNLPRSWRPDRFIKLKALPKTANGKPQLSKLKAMLNLLDNAG